MANVLGCILMAAITFPISFLVARTCLRGVIRMVTAPRVPAPGWPWSRARSWRIAASGSRESFGSKWGR